MVTFIIILKLSVSTTSFTLMLTAALTVQKLMFASLSNRTARNNLFLSKVHYAAQGSRR